MEEQPNNKDKLRIVLRDTGKYISRGRCPLLYFIFLVPLIFTLLFGWVYSENTVHRIPLVIYDQEHTAASRALTQVYGDSERFEIIAYVQTDEALQEYLHSDEALVALEIPANFSKDVKSGKGGRYLLTVNSTNNIFGNSALAAAKELNRSVSVEASRRMIQALGVLPGKSLDSVYPVHFQLRILNNPINGYMPFILTGLMLNGLQIGLMLVIAPLAIREIQRPRYGRRFPFPILFLGETLPLLGLTLLSFYLSFSVVVYGFDVPMRGNWLAVGGLVTGFIVFLIAVLNLLSSLSLNEVTTLQFPLIYIMPGLLFSGLSWPPFAMNTTAILLATLMPITYTGDAIRDIMLAGSSPDMWHNMGIMFFAAFVCFCMTAVVIRIRQKKTNEEVVA